MGRVGISSNNVRRVQPFSVRSFASEAHDDHAEHKKADHFLERDDVVERVIRVVKGFEKVDPNKVTEKSHFTKDLGLDSLDCVEVVMALESEFFVAIPDREAEMILTVEDAVKFILAHPRAL